MACSAAEDLAENPDGVVEDTTALKELQRAGLGLFAASGFDTDVGGPATSGVVGVLIPPRPKTASARRQRQRRSTSCSALTTCKECAQSSAGCNWASDGNPPNVGVCSTSSTCDLPNGDCAFCTDNPWVCDNGVGLPWCGGSNDAKDTESTEAQDAGGTENTDAQDGVKEDLGPCPCFDNAPPCPEGTVQSSGADAAIFGHCYHAESNAFVSTYRLPEYDKCPPEAPFGGAGTGGTGNEAEQTFAPVPTILDGVPLFFRRLKKAGENVDPTFATAPRGSCTVAPSASTTTTPPNPSRDQDPDRACSPNAADNFGIEGRCGFLRFYADDIEITKEMLQGGLSEPAETAEDPDATVADRVPNFVCVFVDFNVEPGQGSRLDAAQTGDLNDPDDDNTGQLGHGRLANLRVQFRRGFLQANVEPRDAISVAPVDQGTSGSDDEGGRSRCMGMTTILCPTEGAELKENTQIFVAIDLKNLSGTSNSPQDRPFGSGIGVDPQTAFDGSEDDDLLQDDDNDALPSARPALKSAMLEIGKLMRSELIMLMQLGFVFDGNEAPVDTSTTRCIATSKLTTPEEKKLLPKYGILKDGTTTTTTNTNKPTLSTDEFLKSLEDPVETTTTLTPQEIKDARFLSGFGTIDDDFKMFKKSFLPFCHRGAEFLFLKHGETYEEAAQRISSTALNFDDFREHMFADEGGAAIITISTATTSFSNAYFILASIWFVTALIQQ